MLRVFLLLSFTLVSGAAFAEADGPDSWRVTGVSSNDTLSVRAGPAVSYPRIGRLAHNARGCSATTTLAGSDNQLVRWI